MNLNMLKKKQATKEVKLSLREKKHQANLRKNSGLYFQIGLIATLFIVFGVFQLKFVTSPVEIELPPIDIGEVIKAAPIDFIIEENIPKEVKTQAVITKPKSLDNFEIIENDSKVLVDLIETPPVIVDKPMAVVDVDVVEAPVVIDTIPISLVSDYPEYPGCDKFSDKKRKFECFQQKIAKHIQRKFDSDIAAENGLTGIQKITIVFTINHEGNIVDVKARAPHPELQKEAVKAVMSLPKMKPAKQGYKKVNVTYALPLLFKVD
ncbi:MAG: energy transducer TonB [Flavobacteriaceae bacterium]|nr:energy transducer TonB [Flavobacteriaceae bacterium]